MSLPNPETEAAQDLLAAVPDYGTVDLGSLVLNAPLTLTGKTGVKIRGGQIYWTGPPTVPAIELVSSARCELKLDLLQGHTGVARVGTGLRIRRADGGGPVAVKNVVKIGLVYNFETGIDVGAGSATSCDENTFEDGTVVGCVDGMKVFGGNTQLQYLDRVRFEQNSHACVYVKQGGVQMRNGTLAYSPYGVLIGEANPTIVLRDVFCEGGSNEMLYVASEYNTNNPGTLIIEGGMSGCKGPAGFDGFPSLSLRWNHNAPFTLNSHSLWAPMLVEEGTVFGRGINLLDPNIEPADYFYTRGHASYDVAGSQQQADGTWRAWSYMGTGKSVS